MLHNDKPALDENLLEHHGIKGMRWGIRKHATGGQIRTARRSVARTRMNIEDARAQVRAGKAPKDSIAKAKLAHLNNPDRPTAARMTRGEIAVSAILLTPAATLGLVAGTQIKSRLVESRQTDNSYTTMANRHANR